MEKHPHPLTFHKNKTYNGLARCDICGRSYDSEGYHCDVCRDYDNCFSCYANRQANKRHSHALSKRDVLTKYSSEGFCNICGSPVRVAYQCDKCFYYDICKNCYDKYEAPYEKAQVAPQQKTNVPSHVAVPKAPERVPNEVQKEAIPRAKQTSKTEDTTSFSLTDSFSNSFEGEWKDFDVQKQFIHQALKSLPDFKMASAEPIMNAGFQRLFHGEIEKVEKREKLPEFQPSLHTEKSANERMKVLQKLNELTKDTKHNRKCRILRCWHGTDNSAIPKLADTGFAAIAKLDSGWFGKGIYLSSNPEYALRYAKGKANPCLIFCYVIIANPYPIVYDDAPSQKDLRFYSMGNYKNYLSHYAPVIPYGDPSLTMDFRPPPIGKDAKYDEIVIFNENHVVPTFAVKLTPMQSEGVPKVIQKSESLDSLSLDGVCKWFTSLSLTQDYTAIIKKNGIDGAVLTTMNKDDLKEIGITVFGDIRKIESALQKTKN